MEKQIHYYKGYTIEYNEGDYISVPGWYIVNDATHHRFESLKNVRRMIDIWEQMEQMEKELRG